MDQQGAGNASGLGCLADRHIVGNDDHGDIQPLAAGAFGGEAKVEAIAGIVLDHQQATGVATDLTYRGEHRLDAGGGEQAAGNYPGQHAFADKTRVGRFVAGAPAGEHRDLFAALLLPVPLLANEDAKAAFRFGNAQRRRRRDAA